jgi:hypothetical protein
MRFLISFAVASVLATVSCKDLKDQQLDAFVGDKETKIVYRNVGENAISIPKDRQIGFPSQSDAIDQGFTPENLAGTGNESSEE